MTMMAHILLRLRGDEDWDAWGDHMKWYDRADRIGELRVEINYSPLAPGWLEDRPHRRLDVLVVWRLDRLGRNLRHLVTLLDELARGRGVVRQPRRRDRLHDASRPTAAPHPRCAG